MTLLLQWTKCTYGLGVSVGPKEILCDTQLLTNYLSNVHSRGAQTIALNYKTRKNLKTYIYSMLTHL